jgi:inner membrane protein
LCGTFPDLDVFIPFGDPVKDFTYHRSFSHSLFVLALVTPLMVWLILKLHPQTSEHRRNWFALVYLVFATHVLLDSFTVYGTQIFWPIDDTPMTWSTIFIIDPLYTLPLLIGVLAALVLRRNHRPGHYCNNAGLILSTAYLAWSLTVKLHVDALARDALEQQNIAYRHLLSTPAPFNTLLWRVLAMDAGAGRYYEGFYSLLDEDKTIRFQSYPSATHWLQGIENHWPVQRLQWFSKGFYAVSRQQNDIIITDLRMGVEPDYVFRFKVAEISNPHAVARAAERLSAERNWQRVGRIWQRIWNRNIEP